MQIILTQILQFGFQILVQFHPNFYLQLRGDTQAPGEGKFRTADKKPRRVHTWHRQAPEALHEDARIVKPRRSSTERAGRGGDRTGDGVGEVRRERERHGEAWSAKPIAMAAVLPLPLFPLRLCPLLLFPIRAPPASAHWLPPSVHVGPFFSSMADWDWPAFVLRNRPLGTWITLGFVEGERTDWGCQGSPGIRCDMITHHNSNPE